MIAFKEFIKRSMDGPVMSEQDFDLKLSRTLRNLSASIHFKPGEVICDDATADAIFQSALKMLSQVGIYNLDTNRVILLSKEEVEATCRETPKQFTRGGGKDNVTVKARKHDSKTPPYIFRDPIKNFRYKGIEPALLDMIKAYQSDESELGKLARELKESIEGVENKANTVGEIVWAEAIAKWKTATARAVGEPDRYVGIGSAIGVPAILVPFSRGIYQKNQSCIPVHIMPELKLNWDRLTLAYSGRVMGVTRWVSANSIIGGYARNAVESAIIVVASILGQLSYAAGDWAHLDPIDIKGHYTTRPVLQAYSMACRAAERNIGVPTAGKQESRFGLGTDVSLYEKAAAITAQTCSGMGWAWGYFCHPGKNGEPKTDLDGKLVMKVSKAVSGMARHEANELVNKILGVYEGRWEQEDKGKPFVYYYDLKTLTPSQELVDLHKRVEAELVKLGVPLS